MCACNNMCMFTNSDVVYESSSSYTTSHRYSKKPFYIKNWDEKGMCIHQYMSYQCNYLIIG